MHTVTLYGKSNCPLCDHTRHFLRELLAARPDTAAWTLDEVNILDDQDLYAAYRYVIPVVVVNGGPPLEAPASLDRLQLAHALAGSERAAPADAAPGRGAIATTAVAPPDPVVSAVATALPEPDAAGPDAAAPAPAGMEMPVSAPAYPSAYPYAFAAAPPRGALGALDRLGNGLCTHWLAIANTGVGIFSTLPWLAPIFAKLGWWPAADAIYTIYMFFCHQLPERAGSLFGYQVAYCYRNSAIYSSIFFLGLLYGLARRQGSGGPLGWMLTPLRWQVFVLLLIPIGVDGLTHLLGLREDNAWFDLLTGGRFGDFSVGDSAGTLNWWLRIITGALFGFAIVRLIYPWIQRALDESRQTVWPLRPPAPHTAVQPQPAAP